ncbi:hypothetical protein FOA52_003370 [Chlamydomonas sp. UWO 241]|nr:hypothetical protein FOA52_003370 [Chlamydomonas sp. UWO 241]
MRAAWSSLLAMLTRHGHDAGAHPPAHAGEREADERRAALAFAAARSDLLYALDPADVAALARVPLASREHRNKRMEQAQRRLRASFGGEGGGGGSGNGGNGPSSGGSLLGPASLQDLVRLLRDWAAPDAEAGASFTAASRVRPPPLPGVQPELVCRLVEGLVAGAERPAEGAHVAAVAADVAIAAKQDVGRDRVLPKGPTWIEDKPPVRPASAPASVERGNARAAAAARNVDVRGVDGRVDQRVDRRVDQRLAAASARATAASMVKVGAPPGRWVCAQCGLANLVSGVPCFACGGAPQPATPFEAEVEAAPAGWAGDSQRRPALWRRLAGEWEAGAEARLPAGDGGGGAGGGGEQGREGDEEDYAVRRLRNSSSSSSAHGGGSRGGRGSSDPAGKEALHGRRGTYHLTDSRAESDGGDGGGDGGDGNEGEEDEEGEDGPGTGTVDVTQPGARAYYDEFFVAPTPMPSRAPQRNTAHRDARTRMLAQLSSSEADVLWDRLLDSAGRDLEDMNARNAANAAPESAPASSRDSGPQSGGGVGPVPDGGRRSSWGAGGQPMRAGGSNACSLDVGTAPRKPMNVVLSGMPTTIFEVMSMLARKHESVNLGQGFPDDEGPYSMKAVAADALTSFPNQYPPLLGVPELRQAVAAHSQREQGIPVDWATETLITVGATEGIAACFMGLLNPGDEVIIFDPCYDSYAGMARMAGAVLVPVRLSLPDFSVPVDELSAAFSERTKLILVNTPHNPSGKVFTEKELSLVARLCVQHDVICLCDEVYEHLVFGGAVHVSPRSLPGMRERSIRLGSAGKTFSFTAWKIGWMTGPAALLAPIIKAHQFLVFTVPSNLQRAVAAGLDGETEFYHGLGAALERKRSLLEPRLQALGFRTVATNGAYFVVADASAFLRDGENDDLFAQRLTVEAGVTVIPVSAFYVSDAPPRHLVRFCYCKDDAKIAAACERLEAYLGQKQ